LIKKVSVQGLIFVLYGAAVVAVSLYLSVILV
jgi:hypothetical protein